MFLCNSHVGQSLFSVWELINHCLSFFCWSLYCLSFFDLRMRNEISHQRWSVALSFFSSSISLFLRQIWPFFYFQYLYCRSLYLHTPFTDSLINDTYRNYEVIVQMDRCNTCERRVIQSYNNNTFHNGVGIVRSMIVKDDMMNDWTISWLNSEEVILCRVCKWVTVTPTNK